MTKDLFSPTMHDAIGHALKHSGGNPEKAVLVRYPGGFWSNVGWQLHQGPYWGTSTIEAVVKRGAGYYTEWKERKDKSKFPVEVRITL